jgi:hypothetical protein
MIFIVSLIVDVVAIADNPKGFDIDDKKQLVPRILCMIVISLLSLYEMMDILINPGTYLKRLWNIND